MIKRAIDLVGSQAGLATAIGVTPQAVSQWLRGSRPVPAGRCRAIEAATSGGVTAEQLRPDVFGEVQISASKQSNHPSEQAKSA